MAGMDKQGGRCTSPIPQATLISPRRRLHPPGDEAVVLAGGIVSDELGRLAQAYCVTEAQLDAPGGAMGVAINIGEAVPQPVRTARPGRMARWCLRCS